MARTLTRTLLVLFLLGAAPTASAAPLTSLSYQGCVSESSPLCGPGNLTPGLTGIADVAVSPDGRSAYAASQGSRIASFARNPRTGALTARQCFAAPSGPTCTPTPGIFSPVAIAVSPDGRDVYAVNSGSSSVVSFARDAGSGDLQRTGCRQAPGPTDCLDGVVTPGLYGANAIAFSPDGRFVYVTSPGTQSSDPGNGAVLVFSRDASGGSLDLVRCYEDTGGSTQGCVSAPGLRGADGVTASADGRSLYVAARTGDSITSFDRNTADGTLSNATPNTATGLDGPTAVAASPDGRSVYTTAQDADAVVRFDRTPGASALTAGGCIQNTGGNTCPATQDGLRDPRDIEVSADGASVVVGSYGPGGSSSLLQFSRSSSGLIGAAECFDASGLCGPTAATISGVRGLGLSPDGASVLVASQGSSTLSSFARELPPVCLPATSGGGTQAVALDCYDPNGSRVSIEPVTGPANGSLGAVDQKTQRVTYTPNPGFSGVDSFTYRASSNDLTGPAATATVVVPGSGQPPAPGPAITVPGPTRVVREPAPLVAALADTAFTAKRGRRVTLRFAVTRASAVAVTISRNGKTVATLRKTVGAAGRSSVSWNGRIKRKAAPAGSYRVAFVARAGSERATDRASLKLTR